MKLNQCQQQSAALAALFVTMSITAWAQTPFTRGRRAPAQSVDRYGNLPLATVIRTDERYGHNGLFRGPRGWDYWNLLENPKEHQNPNLWPDKRPTYFVGQLQMPPGTTLTIRGRFMRFMVCQPEWGHSPTKVHKPGMEESVMGPYYPRGYYTTKAEFELKGPKKMMDMTPIAAAEHRTVKQYTIDGTRNMRFGEILVVKQTGIEVYNTTGLNNCPPELWNALDFDTIKQQFGAPAVQKNGPHYWMIDSQTVSFGEQVTFGALQARWAATLDAAVAAKAAKGSVPYQVFTPKKTQKMVYSKGKPVYELIDPDGHI
jgi:hypothetical protein